MLAASEYGQQRIGQKPFHTDDLTVVLANRRPGTPSNVEPADGANVNTLMPTLRGSAYTDPDGDAHYKTWWEIKRVSDNATIWDSDWRTTDPTSTIVPSGKLAAGVA